MPAHKHRAKYTSLSSGDWPSNANNDDKATATQQHAEAGGVGGCADDFDDAINVEVVLDDFSKLAVYLPQICISPINAHGYQIEITLSLATTGNEVSLVAKCKTTPPAPLGTWSCSSEHNACLTSIRGIDQELSLGQYLTNTTQRLTLTFAIDGLHYERIQFR